MIAYGLENATIKNLQNIFSDYDEIIKVIIYGSRAKGNFRNGSDIDLTLFGSNLTINILFEIEEKIEELCLPYLFDISIYHQIGNPDLIEHINRVGKVFYKKKSL